VKRTLIIAAVILSTVAFALPASAVSIDSYINGPWMKFLFPEGAGGDATGSCSNCQPGQYDPIVELENPPWTFTLADMAEFRITDAFWKGDSFEVYDFGNAILTTPIVPIDTSSSETNPENSYASSVFSHGSVILAPGNHSFTIKTVTSPYEGGGAAFFRIDRIIDAPEPMTLMLLGLGLLGLSALRRARG
jgi:hypothetical protein